MNYNSKHMILPALALLLTGAAGCKNYSGEKAASDRAKWVDSLEDSIALVSKARQADSVQIEELRTALDNTMEHFSQVNNSREVEPYYILTSHRNAYPLNSTGVAARVTNSLQFELVAALSGKRFDAVRLTSEGATVNSTVIPPDQGLNYTSADGLSVCSFSGGENTPLGQFVDLHYSAPIRLDYLRNGAVQSSITLSDAQKRWIAQTWQLTSQRQTLDSLESKQIINARKLEILHITLNKERQSAASKAQKAP